MRQVTAVTFDLWQTLISDTLELEQRRKQIRIDRIHELSAVSKDSLGRAHDAVHDELQPVWKQDRDVTHEDQVRRFLQLAGASASPAAFDEIARIYREATLEILPEILPGAADVLKEVHRRGLPIGLVSNTFRTPGRVLRPILEKFDLARYFKVMVFSDEAGIRKPSPEIFRMALRVLGAPPGETVHIGDTHEADVVGAQRAGMRAIHLHPTAVRSLREVPALIV